ncbi:hypothetical protein ALI22I_06915 [Saccharothrix sp. ALI-22-I]|uniref:AfsR/SARP family transcriptional regulator n=1 Tax=Saccharothrix sp. ALI-22-I TaxID=1933778 RepID=UPI00097C21AD|nr:BTAD domain-containing putative transcriptional regulator [Saccharothrix sp. ALI-22-I]ONI91809.1 hypothetical protein ALI22I_06915 [Saccharothrix sp. ALI-22-I]
MAVEFRVLGDVSIEVDGTPVDAGPARQRSVLAVLLVNANQVTSTDRLVDRVWDGRPPRRARGALASHISRIRALLSGTASIESRASGYVLFTEPGSIDLHEFRRLVAKGEKSVPVLQRALELWRGEPFAGLDCRWLDELRPTLRQEHLAAQLDLVDAELADGRHSEVLPELIARAHEHPLDERVAGQLLLGLYRSGRQADALQHYQDVRARLALELGTDPGPVLQRLHQDVLTGARHAPVVVPRPVPRQLPAAPRGFTSRTDELAVLTAALDDSARPGHAPTVVVSALAGIGGIGKTWLALRWAHQHLDRFPDGQLFVNLRGFDPSGRPVPAPLAVRGFLDALGVDPNAIPREPDAQSALYRSLVADKRMLIVLDNAANTAQVVPLLPGGSTCTVLVTSRDWLTGLVAAHGAQPLRLEVLPEPDARSLLAARIDPDRLTAEPNAVDELLLRCAGLPLALSIVASRAQTHHELPLATIAAELQRAATRLGALDENESATSIRAVLSWSTTALTAHQARTFALLGAVPMPDISLAAVARLIDTTADEAAVVLRSLERVSLVQQHSAGRYRMHDLVRDYAAEQQLSETDRRAALVRLVDHYTDTVRTNSRSAFPSRSACVLDPPEAERPRFTPSDRTRAWAWYHRERTSLVAIEQTALQLGLHTQVWRLAWHLTAFRTLQGLFEENLSAWQDGLAVATRLGRADTQFFTFLMIGYAYLTVGEHSQALDHFRLARTSVDETGNPEDRGELEIAFSIVLGHQEELSRALEHARCAHRLLEGNENLALEAKALVMVGSLAAMLGDHQEGRRALEDAISLEEPLGDLDNHARTLRFLADIERRTGRREEALRLYERVCADNREANNAFDEANALISLGELHLESGSETEARIAWLRAVELLSGQHRTTEACQLQQRLDPLLEQNPLAHPFDRQGLS